METKLFFLAEEHLGAKHVHSAGTRHQKILLSEGQPGSPVQTSTMGPLVGAVQGRGPWGPLLGPVPSFNGL